MRRAERHGAFAYLPTRLSKFPSILISLEDLKPRDAPLVKLA